MKKGLITAIAAAAVVIIAVLVLVIGNASIPEITEEEIVNEIILQCEPQLQEMREKYNIPDLQLKLEPAEVRITKPTLFKEGRIYMEFKDYLVSPSLDTAEYTEELYEQYSQAWTGARFGAFDSYSALDISIEKYGEYFFIDRANDHDFCFVDDKGNEYDFYHEYVAFGIRKNGEVVFSKSTGLEKEYNSGGSGDGSGKCEWCNGTGAVKYYYGDSDLQAALEGHDASWYGVCGSCGGDGKR